jgi:hypothetical protein
MDRGESLFLDHFRDGKASADVKLEEQRIDFLKSGVVAGLRGR